MTVHRSLAIALFGFGAALHAGVRVNAEELCFTSSVAQQSTNWQSSVTLPRFDRALGTLQSISVEVVGRVDGTARVENLDSSASVVAVSFHGEVETRRPDQSSICMIAPGAEFLDTFTPFDGLRDFRGTSGATHSGIECVMKAATLMVAPTGDFDLFSGPFGKPGQIILPVVARGMSVMTGAGNVLSHFTQTASAEVTVRYQFTPFAPPVMQCVGTQIGSVGVALSFDICAWMASTEAPASLTASGMPLGARLESVSGSEQNTMCGRFTWTPTPDQVGSSTVTFTATDGLMHSVTCTVTLIAAECHMLFATATGSSHAIVFDHIYDTQLAGVRRHYAVTMDAHPTVRASSLPPVFVVQVVMYNPLVFPATPSRSSKPMTVTRDASGHMQSSYSGIDDGIGVRLHEFFVDGVRYVRFPFEVSGM